MFEAEFFSPHSKDMDDKSLEQTEKTVLVKLD